MKSEEEITRCREEGGEGKLGQGRAWAKALRGKTRPGLLQKHQGGRVRGSLMKRGKVGGPGRVQGWSGLAGHMEVVEFDCERTHGTKGWVSGFF